jgi:hypothetical protein
MKRLLFIKGAIPEFSWRDWRKPRKISAYSWSLGRYSKLEQSEYKSDVLPAASTWSVTPCSFLHLERRQQTCETFVHIYQTIRRIMPEDFPFNIHRLITSNVKLKLNLNLHYTIGPYVIVFPGRCRRWKTNDVGKEGNIIQAKLC